MCSSKEYKIYLINVLTNRHIQAPRKALWLHINETMINSLSQKAFEISRHAPWNKFAKTDISPISSFEINYLL